jgi:hypothetical protein
MFGEIVAIGSSRRISILASVAWMLRLVRSVVAQAATALLKNSRLSIAVVS